MSHRQAVVFDVNETMLDLGALDPLFVEWFGDSGASRGWFAQTLHLAITLAAIRTFRNFGEIGVAALAMEAQRRDVALPDDFPARLREAVLRLPAYRDVASALSLLRDAGLTTAALTNNPLPVVQEQLTYAGIAGLFDEIMSVDEAGVLKPAPEVYAFATERLDLPPYSVWMVAAHGWDIAGAMRSGLRGAFVARPGQLADPFAPPEIVGGNLIEVARAIVAMRAATP